MQGVHTEAEERLSWDASSLAELAGVNTEALCCALLVPGAKGSQSEGISTLLLDKACHLV